MRRILSISSTTATLFVIRAGVAHRWRRVGVSGASRKGLLAVFELLGDQGELVNSYRRKLFTLMH